MPPLLSQRVREVISPYSVAREESYSFTTRSVTGSPFTGTTADFVAYPVAVHGYFNWRNVSIARAVCTVGDAVVEIGANIGSETVGFSDVVAEGGAVYAFEPFPPNLELLRLNARQTNHRNISVLPLALSDREAQIRFAVPVQGNSGSGYVLGSTDNQGNSDKDTGTVEVPCTTLDAMSEQLRRPRLIVIDAEGHEGAILRGAEQLISEARPVIVLEVIEQLLAPFSAVPERYLSRCGHGN
jgi:FkbM family methyltransferase